MSDGEVIEIQNDSDCELLPEPEISVVEVTDSQDEDPSGSSESETEISSQEEEHTQEDNSQEEEHTQEDNSHEEEHTQEDNSQKDDDSQKNQNQEDQIQENIGETNNQTTLFRMCFNNEENFVKLKNFIMEAIRSCMKQNGINVDFIEDQNFLDICVFEKTQSSIENLENEITTNTLDESEVVDSTVVDLCFQIDTTPQANLDKRTIPCYKRSIKEVLKGNNKKQKVDPNECARPKGNTCFNCLGNHSLKDCSEPRNQQKINRNRKAHAIRSERYHIEGKQKFAHLKPGHISDNLKRALGLQNGELPPFVYKMRLLGYPPGWLEEAKIPHSGLVLFDSDGRRVTGSDEEDGEVDVIKYKYDIEKIISFPGYNVDPGPNYFDDYKYHGVPPMLPKFRKEEFIKSLGDDNILKGYKRKKLKDLSVNSNSAENIPEDMEIEDVDDEVTQITNLPPLPPPLPSEPAPPTPPPPPPQLEDDGQNLSIEEYTRNSPSLDELEERQKQLLEALQNSSSSILDISTEDIQQDNEEEMEETITKQNSQESEPRTMAESDKNSSDARTIDNSQLNDNSISSTPCTPVTSSTLKTISQSQTSTKLMLGTPILKFSPYDKLPSGEKFSVGVSDVINFENLADSTGKYEQMKKVLQKIRNVVTQLNMND